MADEEAPEKAPEPHASETTSPQYIGAASISGIETGSPVQAYARRKHVASWRKNVQHFLKEQCERIEASWLPVALDDTEAPD